MDSSTSSRVCHIIEEEFNHELSIKRAEVLEASSRLSVVQERLSRLRCLLLSQANVHIVAPPSLSDLSASYVALPPWERPHELNDDDDDDDDGGKRKKNTPLIPSTTNAIGARISNSNSSSSTSMAIDGKKARCQQLILRRDDGEFMFVRCPTCRKQDFVTLEAVRLHCRYVHRLVFASAYESLNACGVVIAASTVPHDHPARTEAPVSKLLNNSGANERKSMVHKSSNATVIEEKVSSRFYTVRRIVIGNTSQYIQESQRDASDNSTHKWLLYVRGPAEEPDISSFVDHVRFYLHPSYKPNDIIEVTSAPFHLSRRGWGEFPVRVQLHLRSGDKPVDLVHPLSLDQHHTGLQVLGGESAFDVEVNRRFFEALRTDKAASVATVDISEYPSSYVDDLPLDASVTDINEGSRSLEHHTGKLLQPVSYTDAPSPVIKNEAENIIEDVGVEHHPIKDKEGPFDGMDEAIVNSFKAGARFYPAFDSNQQRSFPYTIAKSLTQYTRVWTDTERLCAERERALAIDDHIAAACGTRLGVKRVIELMLSAGYCPRLSTSRLKQPSLKQEIKQERIVQAAYCPFCGLSHDLKNVLGTMPTEQCCQFWVRNGCIEISSLSTPTELLSAGRLIASQAATTRQPTEPIIAKAKVAPFPLPSLQSPPTIIEATWVQARAAEVGASLTSTTAETDDREDVSATELIWRLVGMFARHLGRAALEVSMSKSLSDNDMNDDETPNRLIVPLHLHEAVLDIPSLDFLLSTYTGTITNKH